MLTNTDILNCKTAKDTFETRYRISSLSMASIMDRMVYAGGAFASILLKESPYDIDLYIMDTQDNDYEIFQKYSDVNSFTINKKHKSSDVYKNVNPHIHSVWKMDRNNVKYDIIFTNYKAPDEIISDFDYVHSKVWFYNGKLSLSGSTYKSIMDMKLVPASSKEVDPKRRQKFIDRGWKE